MSKGTEVDFQVGANAYLYGTRFMSYLALLYSPEKLIDWCAARTARNATTPPTSNACTASRSTEAWQEWIAGSTNSRTPTLRPCATHPITPLPRHRAARARRLVAGAPEPRRKSLYAAVRYPGRVPHLVAISMAMGAVRELVEIKGAMSYRVASLAYDPATETLFYTTDNLTYRNLMAYDIKSPAFAMLLKARASATSHSILRTARCGACGPTTASSCWCACRIRTGNGSPCTCFHSAK